MTKYSFSGACASNPWPSLKTCSVGVYELVPRASGKGEKRGKVKVRVSGNVGDSQAICDRAAEICKQLDAGTYKGPKNVRVRP